MKRQYINFSNILLSVENPRLDVSFSEAEAISNMIADQKEKIIELAADIVAYGLNPLDSVAVLPSDIYKGFYEVAEGNRRVCALKLLEKPDILLPKYMNYYDKVSQLADKFTFPEQIEVLVFDDEKQIQHWMEIRHMGEQGGKGLSKWNSVQKMRFEKKQTGSNALLDFWTWMDAKKILTFNQIFAVTKTNWQRILRENYYPFLKIYYDGKYSVPPEDMPLFTERIRAIQRGLAGQTVGIVYDQRRIEEFYNMVSQELYGLSYSDVVKSEKELKQEEIELNSVNKLAEDIPFVDQIDKRNSFEVGNNDYKVNVNNGHSNLDKSFFRKDVFDGCRTIIPYAYNIRSSNMRVNKIIHELKELDPERYPNACGTLLRALFELSAKVFLENQTGESMTEKEFQQTIRNAANELRNIGRLSNDAHSAIIKEVDSLRSIFNGYMHNTDRYPSSIALKNLFKAHVGFLTECLK